MPVLGWPWACPHCYPLSASKCPRPRPLSNREPSSTALLVGVRHHSRLRPVPAVSATRVAPMEALRSATPVSERIGRVRTATGVAAACRRNRRPDGRGTDAEPACPDRGWRADGLWRNPVVAGPQLARGIAAAHQQRAPRWRLEPCIPQHFTGPPARGCHAMALTVGLAVVCAVSVTASSIKASAAGLCCIAGNRSDLILRSVTNTSGMSPAVADIIKRQTGVDTVVEWRYSQARVNGNVGNVVGVPAADLGSGGGPGHRHRLPSAISATEPYCCPPRRPRNSMPAWATSIRVTFPETGERSFQVAATFDLDSLVGTGQLLSLNDYAANVTSRLDDMPS